MQRGTKVLTLTDLKNSGFKRAGCWKKGQKDRPKLHGKFPPQAGIYLFAVGNKLKYVGTSNKLPSRLRQYDHNFQGRCETPRLVDRAIIEELRKGREVTIYIRVLAEDRISYRKGLPFDSLAGLEAGLIEETKSEWNKGARKRIAKGQDSIQ
jgi:hypothetical protein